MQNPSTRDNDYLLDPESAAEMGRLLNQDLLITNAVGELLPDELDLAHTRKVLDVACGPGGWAIEAAYVFQEVDITGFDISRSMIEYAAMRAQSQQLTNAHFRVMNALESWDFENNSFDLVNARALVGFMSPEKWPDFLAECLRVTRPGGGIRLIEGESMGMSTSPALEELNRLGVTAMQRIGRTFSRNEPYWGLQLRLSYLLRKAGYTNVQVKSAVIDFSKGMPAHDLWVQNLATMLKTGQPFLVKTRVVEQVEAEKLYQQALEEMEADDFCGLVFLTNVFGQKPA